jgi:hypothetical protein
MQKDMVVRATKDQLEEFKRSIIWKDIVQELNTWKRAFKAEQFSIVEEAATSNPSTAAVLLHMGDINGRIKAVEYILSLPNIFLQSLEDKVNDSRHN